MTICSFGDKYTKIFFETGKAAQGLGWSAVKNIARRKLDMIHYAHELSDLKSPPGNRLEALKGNLKDFYSIRINDQWRIIFKWSQEGPEEVQVLDYH